MSFQENDTVILRNPADFDGEAIWYDEEGEQHTETVELPKDGEYEIISIDYDPAPIYNLRLDGEVGEHDYVRVWGVSESHILAK